MRRLAGLLALVLAGAALAPAARADGMSSDAGLRRVGHHAHGMHRPAIRHRHGARAHGHRGLRRHAPPHFAGAYYAWPDPASVRTPIYNRPHHIPRYE